MKRNGFVLASLVLTGVWVIELITRRCVCVCVCVCVSAAAAMPFRRDTHSHRWVRRQSKPKQRTCNHPPWIQISVCPFPRVFVPLLIFLLRLMEAFVSSDKPWSGVCVCVSVCVCVCSAKSVFSGVYFYQTYITPRCHKYSLSAPFPFIPPSFLHPSIHPSPPTSLPSRRHIKSPQLKNKYGTLKHKIWNWFILCFK